MRALPASSSMDAVYARSSLKKRRGPIEFDDLRSRVRHFSRNSLVAIGARVLWGLWKQSLEVRTDVEAGRDLRQITWSHAAGVIGLACIYAPERGRPHGTEDDFRVLAYELFACPTGSHLVQDSAENAALAARLSDIAKRSSRGRLTRIPSKDIAAVHVASVLARLARAQLGGHPVRAESRRVRASVIYEFMLQEAERRTRAAASGSATDLAAVLQRAEHAVLRTDYVNYMRGMMALCHYAHDSGSHLQRDDVCPGVMLLDRGEGRNHDDWAPTRWADVLVTAERLATPIDEARESIAALGRIKPWEQASASQVWFLRCRPLILLPPEEPDVLKVLAPDPWLLEDIVERELLQEIPSAAHSDDAPFLSIRGDAFQTYLQGGFGALDDVTDVDALGGLKDSGRRPDFLWMGERFGVVVEAKLTLSPHEDTEHRVNTSVLKAWALGCEAIEQGCAFIRSGHPAVGETACRTWIMVIVTMEPGAADVTHFAAAAKRWAMLDDSPFVALHVADVAELEHFALTGSPDAYAEMLIERWGSLSIDFRDGLVPVDYQETMVMPSLAEAWDRLFSATSNPWTSTTGNP